MFYYNQFLSFTYNSIIVITTLLAMFVIYVASCATHVHTYPAIQIISWDLDNLKKGISIDLKRSQLYIRIPLEY